MAESIIDEVPIVEEEEQKKEEGEDDSHPVLNEVVDSSPGTYIGQCKWFNDKLGYGFITICDGDKKGVDIFVHHTGIKPQNSNYKTLRKGEYINFNIVTGINGLQAVDITGINGGPLMCDVMQGFNPQAVPMPQQYTPRTQEGWQTVPTRGKPTYARAVSGVSVPPPPPPPPPGSPGEPKAYQKRVKNVNKYSKETRGVKP